ncbi:MAG: DUF1592 domain-containing protein [Planctomycetales bacterium]|nr:DUF1592 domain-containing protein [Planctomycetales bacterium]
MDPVPAAAYVRTAVPFLQQYCSDCHAGDGAEGGIDFDRFEESSQVQGHYDLWEKSARMIKAELMPPGDADQPTTDERRAVVAAIQAELASYDCSAARRPGRVTIQRLNRAEYDNTIRDLLGLDLNLADDFPSDDVGAGFDNVGDVLSLPPILLEKYLASARVAAQQALRDPEARKRILREQPTSDDERLPTARRNIQQFAEQAFRRPLADDEVNRLMEIAMLAWQQDVPESEIVETVITAILASPHFIFRVEKDPDETLEDARKLNGFELASRLSYFLWSSMPDDELFRLARAGELTKPGILETQAKRMLLDPKAEALVDNFAGQWLQLRDLANLMPDPNRFPEFDGELRNAMRRETEMLFATIMREDRSVLDFLTADYTFVNERLAKHYGMNDVSGDSFREVALDNRRRGVLTHGSILLLTSNPTRTSPVKRGKWVLENLLDEPPPAPPPNVPVLEEDAETLGTLREQMEQHRSNPTCSSCHRMMDALGFGLENFDAIGMWRTVDGQHTIDPSGSLPGGEAFSGPVDLARILAEEKKYEFCQCLARRMMIYALGRDLESYDRCTIRDVVESTGEADYRFSALVTAIVTSDAFTMRETRRED